MERIYSGANISEVHPRGVEKSLNGDESAVQEDAGFEEVDTVSDGDEMTQDLEEAIGVITDAVESLGVKE